MSTVARAAMKCSSNVAMALSAALTRWLCGGMSWMLICSDLMYFSTAAKHSLSITFSAGWYPPVLRVVITSLNAVTMDASVQEGMAQTMIALRSYTCATKIYCILLNERTGNALVMLVYIVPVMVMASAAKQITSCMVHISC